MIKIVPFGKENVEELYQLIKEAWDYYVQDVDPKRVQELLEFYVGDETKEFWLAYENDKLVGMAEITITESYRYPGEEARLELLYIRNSVENYYDVHAALMDRVFDFLKEQKIDYIRVDTTLENADLMTTE